MASLALGRRSVYIGDWNESEQGTLLNAISKNITEEEESKNDSREDGEDESDLSEGDREQ